TVTQSFYTLADNQTGVDCRITQANDPTDDPKWVQVVWDGELELPSGRPAGQAIDVTYSYDENSVMHASFVDVATGNKTAISLSNITPSTEESSKIDDFIVD
ncbi:uncharacterized protein METZ01_LOCUS326747, partial [marine metagenome]